MEFTVVGEKIQCISDSGSTYLLTKDSCTCKGFGFRRTCSHLKEALKLDIFRELEKPKQPELNISRSDDMIRARKDALRQFLKKHNVDFTEDKIEAFEPQITTKTIPQKVLEYFGKKPI